MYNAARKVCLLSWMQCCCRRKPKPSPAPASADALIEDERRKMASDVAERNQREGACKAKCEADLEEVKNMPIVAPLPSCARDEEGEGDAGRWMEGNDGLVDTVTKKVMAALGLGVFSQPSCSVQVPFPGVSWESAAPGGR